VVAVAGERSFVVESSTEGSNRWHGEKTRSPHIDWLSDSLGGGGNCNENCVGVAQPSTKRSFRGKRPWRGGRVKDL